MSDTKQEKKFKSQLIVLEGPDGSGKTFQIEKLMTDYPGQFERLKFPREESKAKIAAFLKQMDQNSINDIMKYHFLFIQDIIDFQPELNEILFRNRNKKHVLLDRYYFSSIVYLKFAIQKFYQPNKQIAYTKWHALLEQVLHKWINQCRTPDHVILLIDNFAEKEAGELQNHTHDELQEINKLYKQEIDAYWQYLHKKHRGEFTWEQIEALNKTEYFIQNYLHGHKIIEAVLAKQ